MPLLHFRITEKDESINMSRTLHAQNLTLRRAIITRNPSLQTNVQNEVAVGSAKTQVVPIYDADCKGGIVVDASFLRGYEIMSNFSSNDIMIPFANDSINVDEQFALLNAFGRRIDIGQSIRVALGAQNVLELARHTSGKKRQNALHLRSSCGSTGI